VRQRAVRAQKEFESLNKIDFTIGQSLALKLTTKLWDMQETFLKLCSKKDCCAMAKIWAKQKCQ